MFEKVASLQAQLMQVKAQLAHGMASSDVVRDPLLHSYSMYGQALSPQSSMEDVGFEDLSAQIWNKRRVMQNELSELQALASRMMRN